MISHNGLSNMGGGGGGTGGTGGDWKMSGSTPA